MNDRFEKWDRWLNDIEYEVTDLLRYRHIFHEVNAIVNSNPKIQKPSSFYEFLGHSYAAFALMGIRRQAKIHKDSISFARLLKEICKTPEILSRNRLIPENRKKSVIYSYFEEFTGECKDYVDRDIVKKDLEKLNDVYKRCEGYVDKRLAHFDKHPPKVIPEFKDIDECIDCLKDLLVRYVLLFRSECIIDPLPVHQYDWKVIFKEVWLTD